MLSKPLCICMALLLITYIGAYKERAIQTQPNVVIPMVILAYLFSNYLIRHDYVLGTFGTLMLIYIANKAMDFGYVLTGGFFMFVGITNLLFMLQLTILCLRFIFRWFFIPPGELEAEDWF